LADGDFAVGMVNLYPISRKFHFRFEDAGLAGSFKVRDVWRQADEGVFKDAYCVDLPPHATKVIRIRSAYCSSCQ
jgi:hypothetical protein